MLEPERVVVDGLAVDEAEMARPELPLQDRLGVRRQRLPGLGEEAEGPREGGALAAELVGDPGRVRRQPVEDGDDAFEPGGEVTGIRQPHLVLGEPHQDALPHLVGDEAGAVGGEPHVTLAVGPLAFGQVAGELGLGLLALPAQVGLDLDDRPAEQGIETATNLRYLSLEEDLLALGAPAPRSASGRAEP